MDLKNKVAVITGAASGIGAASAIQLAARGVKIVLGDLNEKGLEAVLSEIKTKGGDAVAVKTNVTIEEDVIHLMDSAIQIFGAIHIVIPSAGIFKDAFMVSPDRETGKVKRFMGTDQFMAVINVNLLGTFLALREASIRMIDNNWNGILFTISSINKEGQIGQLNYSSTKAAVALWPKILVGEFHAKRIKDIRVVGIAPGYVETPILMGMKAEVLDGIIKDVAIGRLVKVKEIVDSIIFSIENDAITGTTLEISGGVIANGLAK
ncbi:SDR family NAD(P)-dependent oxidoreductase [Yeosuana sp.]|uniref:SDR family NAD(P)-dependent oxidoreductase n=1 Tax=Yeosuana sp. TaxID=2529388 RepID=UPI004054BC12|tara:strand:- start:1503 stop:2294 length:792 start_codon:yes stop_codon:yes gene_type:complete